MYICIIILCYICSRKGVLYVCYCSANVLLDLSFRAKVGDFGLARNIQQEEETRTARVVGTSGYIPPEYYRGVITTKMDAFGFGVVGHGMSPTLYNYNVEVLFQILLELISGLPSFDPHRNPKDLVRGVGVSLTIRPCLLPDHVHGEGYGHRPSSDLMHKN